MLFMLYILKILYRKYYRFRYLLGFKCPNYTVFRKLERANASQYQY